MNTAVRRLSTIHHRVLVFAGIWRAEGWRGRLRILRYSIASALLPLFRRRFGTRTYWITLRGRRFLLELARGELAAYLEVWLDRAYERQSQFRVDPGWFVVDVGANAGFFTVLQASRGATVVSIEPNPSVAARLERTIQANDLTQRVTLFRCAAGRTTQDGWIRVDRNTVMGTVSVSGDENEASARRVEIRPLDEILRETSRAIDLLKIDTEGAEHEVLLGSRNTLKRTRRVVLEFHSDELHRSVRELLAAADFGEVLVRGPVAFFLPRPSTRDEPGAMARAVATKPERDREAPAAVNNV